MPLSIFFWLIWVLLVVLGIVYGFRRDGWTCGALILVALLLAILGAAQFGPLVKGAG